MFNKLKKDLCLYKMELLLKKGIADGSIVPFDEEFYSKINNTYIDGLPVSMHIKYFKPIISPGKCYDRSLFIFFCFDNAILVRGNNKDLELRYGTQCAGHGWVEMDNYVYDPSYLMRFDKDLYYKIFMPTEINKINKEEYCSNEDRKKLYDYVKNTTIEDYKPNGNKRIKLATIIPLVLSLSQLSDNEIFIKDVKEYLSLIEYDKKEVVNELFEAIQKHI